MDETNGGHGDSDGMARYNVIKPIGKGKFAIVYRAQRKSDDELVALKKINIDVMDKKNREKTLKEVKLIQSLSHPNIIQYLDSFISGTELIIVFEWAAAGDLKRQIRKAQERNTYFDERVCWKYFSQICDAINYMHEQRVMHRDLKPANIFLTLNGTVKVGDLGLGRAMSEHTMEAHSKVGTPLYMSPEVLRGDGYDWKSDIWSLGCLLYELAMLKSPFKSEGLNLYSLFQKISKGDYQPLPEQYSDELKRLAYAMISTDPADRPELKTACKVAKTMKQRTQGDKPKKIPRPPQPDKKKKIEEKQKKEEVKEDKGGGGEEGDEEEGGDGDETPRKGTSGAISPSIDSKLRSAKNGDRGSKVSIASPVVDKYYREDERRDEGGRDNPQGEGDGDDEEDDEEVNVGDAGGMATMFAGGDGGVDKDEDEVRGADSGWAKQAPMELRPSQGRPVSRGGREKPNMQPAASPPREEPAAVRAGEGGGGGGGEGRGGGRKEGGRMTSLLSHGASGLATPAAGVLQGRMENIHFKLHLIGYHKMVRKRGMGLVTATHFAIEGSGGGGRRGQFMDFLLLSEHLLSEMGGGSPGFRSSAIETETPNAIATGLLVAMQGKGMDPRVASGITPNSLTGGYGEGVVEVLEWAVDKVLEERGYKHGGFVVRKGGKEEEGKDDGEGEAAIEEDDESEIEDEVEGGEEEEDGRFGGRDDGGEVGWGEGRDREMVVSKLDSIEWRSELERVGPRLKVGKLQASGNWQGRIKSMVVYGDKCSVEGKKVEGDLEGVGRRVGEEKERVRRGEGSVNNLDEVRKGKRTMEEVNAETPRITELLGKMSELRTERMNLLSSLTCDISDCKDKLSRKGGEMSDSSGVVAMREGFSKLKEESRELELSLGTMMLSAWGGEDAAEKSKRYKRGEEEYIGVDLEASDDALGGGSIASGMESLAS